MPEPGPSTVEVAAPEPAVPASHRSTKQAAAVVSLAVVLLLGLAKLAVGISSGSLGVVADAIHSGLDFVAALLTTLAVRWADRPPDEDHPYGHARGENVAAFIETLLLIGTAVWISGEAIDRILSRSAAVAPVPLAFAVMIASMAASFWRARAMRSAARQHNSAALDAGALNFSMDVWSSLVVLVGLAIVAIARAFHLSPAFDLADSISGLEVGGFVIFSAVQLARETIDALVDKSPEDLARRLADAVARVPGVIETRRVRLRKAGGGFFADVVAVAPRTAPLAETREITERIEASARQIVPNLDVVVDLRPGIPRAESISERIHLIAHQLGVDVHDVTVRRVNGRLNVGLHVEVDPNLSLAQAHDLASSLEARIAASDPAVGSVTTHLETEPPNQRRGVEITRQESNLVRGIERVADEVLGAGRCHEVRAYRSTGPADERDVVVHCSFPPSMPVTDAHLEAERLEHALREHFPSLADVLVHVEPLDGGAVTSPSDEAERG